MRQDDEGSMLVRIKKAKGLRSATVGLVETDLRMGNLAMTHIPYCRLLVTIVIIFGKYLPRYAAG